MSFFDIQVNGYAGVDFNSDNLSGEDLRLACQKIRGGNVDGILATVITERIPVMERRLRRLAELREQDELVKSVIAGIHIEGPFINANTGYVGAHPADAVINPDEDSMKRLLDAAGGLTRIVTLAPERDAGMRVTRLLASRGITVSAGHCDPSMECLREAIDAGLSMFTHLGNGTPQTMPRHDNIVERVLSLADRLWICFIADGAHVPFFALRNYLKAAGPDRCIAVSDSMSAAGLGPGRYRLSRWDLVIGEDMVARSPDGGHLVGSTISMRQSFENLVSQAGLTREEAETMTSINPRRAIS